MQESPILLGLSHCSGGRGGIRTHEALADLPVFKTGALNRSATRPISTRQALSRDRARTEGGERHPSAAVNLGRRTGGHQRVWATRAVARAAPLWRDFRYGEIGEKIRVQ